MKKILPIAAAFAAFLMLQSVAQAEDKEVAVKIPDTAEAIWQAVDKETDEMSKLIQAGTISGLHQHAFAVRDLVAALPEKSTSLPADKLDKVKANEKFVATLADRLDAAGDGNDKPGAESSFGKLQGILKTMRENYAAQTPDAASKAQ